MKKINESIKEIRDIPLDEIEENPLNANIFNMDDIQALADTIKNEGFSGSINVVKMKNNKYQIYSGHRRYRAMKMLGEKTIPCTVEGDINDTLLIRKLLSSNIQTRKMKPMDYTRAISVYEDILRKENFKGDKRTEIARFFNTGEGQIARLKMLGKLTLRLQKMTDEPNFPYTALVKAANLNVEQQDELANRIEYYKKNYAEDDISSIIIKQYIESILREAEQEKLLKEKKEQEEILKKKLEEDFERTKKTQQIENTIEKQSFIEEEDTTDDPFLNTISVISEEHDFSDVIESVNNDIEERYDDLKNKDSNNISDRKNVIEYKETANEYKKKRDTERANNIDYDIIKTGNLLNTITTRDFNITDNDDVKNAIALIKRAIKKLENFNFEE